MRPTTRYPAVAAADLASALRTERLECGLSLRDVAADVKTSASCVLEWERGTRMPSLVKAIAWAEALGYDLRLQRPAGQPEVTKMTGYPDELLAIAQWIEDDAVAEDQEIADYARGIAKRIRERAAAVGDQWCCGTCKRLAEEGL